MAEIEQDNLEMQNYIRIKKEKELRATKNKTKVEKVV
jgi:hypothetical protein